MNTPARAALIGLSLLALSGSPLSAEDSWNPFREKDAPVRTPRRPTAVAEPERPSLPPMSGVATKPWDQPGPAPRGTLDDRGPNAPRRELAGPDSDARPYQSLPPPAERDRAVERSDLQPVLSGDGSGLPHEFWQGVDARNVHGLVTRLDIPPRSPAMHGLWKRLWTTNATAPGNGPDRHRFEALRIEALYRSGLLKDLLERLEREPSDAASDPLFAALAARARVGAGDYKKGCTEARGLARGKADIAPAIKAEMLLLGGYCAAMDGDAGAAGLAAELVRAEGIAAPIALDALDAIAAGQPFVPVLPKRLSLMDYRFLVLAKSISYPEALERAEPALLVTLATDASIEHAPAKRVQAAELAARLNALDPARLAEIYRAQTFPAADLTEAIAAKGDPTQRRALLFKALESERTPIKRARITRALLDEARRTGLYMPIAQGIAPLIESLAAAPEIGWFAETAIEVNIAAERYDAARRWLAFAEAGERGTDLQHWLLLIDIADPKNPGPRGASFANVEQFALRGRLPPELLHRLATILDALDYQIPIPLWEAASRTPQPATGHLPETGVLTELQDAAKKKEYARTVLLAMAAMGPDGADRTHLIALGDSVRALRRAGLEADARRLALEAVFASWPRMATN